MVIGIGVMGGMKHLNSPTSKNQSSLSLDSRQVDESHGKSLPHVPSPLGPVPEQDRSSSHPLDQPGWRFNREPQGSPTLSPSALRERSRFTTAPIQVPPLPPRPDLAQVGTSGFNQAPLPFTDVAADYWAKPILDSLSAQGLIQGFPDGTFQPDAPMTRADLAAQVARVFNLPRVVPPPSFQDVPPDHWAYDSIQKAVRMGFLKGYPEQQFRPDQAVSKVQVAIALSNGLRIRSATYPERVLQPYQDRDQLPSWAVPAVVAASEARLLSGQPQPDYLHPNRPATRSEVAVMIYRSLVYLGQLEDSHPSDTDLPKSIDRTVN